MTLQAVNSSNLAAVGYDKATKTLRVLFQEGSMYDYFAVPEKLYRELMKSDSKGHFFQEHVIGGMFKYEKVTSEKESTMAKNKQQIATEQRAKAAAQPAAQPVEQPKAAAPAAQPTATAPSKQQVTIDRLKAGWVAKGVDLSKLREIQDGKFVNLVVDEGWPTVRVGGSGGITVMELRSYTKAFDAAVDGLALYQKQQARDAKKTAPAPPPAKAAAPKAAPVPAATPAAAPDRSTHVPERSSPTSRKKAQHDQIETQMQAQA